MFFLNRESAGGEIANKLDKKLIKNPIVVAIPRGGIPVAIPIAKALKASLKLILIRKIGHPFNEEYAIGAVSQTDLLIATSTEVDSSEIDRIVIKERKRIKEMISIFNNQILPVETAGQTVILVDDGIASGYCMKLAVKEIKKNNPYKVIITAPVCSLSSIDMLSEEADEIICMQQPASFCGISSFYQDFHQLKDDEISHLLSRKYLFEKQKY